MKKPIFNYFQRQLILKTNCHHKDVLLFNLAWMKFKRELGRLIFPNIEWFFKLFK
jgi:hypothetical protein